MKKIILSSLFIAGTVALIGINSAQACPGTGYLMGQKYLGYGFDRQEMLELKAEILGITVVQLEEKLKEGKTLKQIIEELGLTWEQVRDRMYEKMQARIEERLQQMVDEGTITQEQADKKMDRLPKKYEKNNGHGSAFMRGFWRGMRLGWHKKEIKPNYA